MPIETPGHPQPAGSVPPALRDAMRLTGNHESAPNDHPHRLTGALHRWPVEVTPFVFFDIETTGLHPDRGARITETALVTRDGVQIDEEFDEGDDHAVSRQLPLLIGHLSAGIVVGHNVQFDLRFIAYEADRLGHEGPRLHFIDTFGLARSLLTGLADYRLKTVLDALGITPPGELHTAIVDVRATRALFWRLMDYGNFGTLAEAGLRPLDWTTF